MKLLILGGTSFLGRHIVEAALARNYEITLFNRGKTNQEIYPSVERLQGNRNGQLESLSNRQWDAVIDTSGFEPAQVRASAGMLRGKVDHYTFISTIDVYRDFTNPATDENSPLDFSEEESYGRSKVSCEQIVQQEFSTGALIIRPGLIVGPYDLTGRFTYWPRRVAQGNEILAPGQPVRLVQFIDARDLAKWLVKIVESKQSGVFNSTGPAYPLTMEHFLQKCRDALDSSGTFTWVSDDFLAKENVTPWQEIPLWMPSEDIKYRNLGSVSSAKAFASGLTIRPLANTIKDTLLWDSTLPIETDCFRFAGLRPDREASLLQNWHQS